MDVRALRNLDLNLLVVLAVLLEEGSVSRAATRLGLTQPAVSAALGRLRSTLDDPLLQKRGGRMVPTPRARQLEPQLRHALELVREVADDGPVVFDASQEQRRFVLAASGDGMMPLWPKLLDRLMTSAPEITLRVENFAAGAAERMEYGDLDCWIVEEHRSDPKLRTEVLWPDRWVVIGCAEYYRRRKVRFEKLEGRLIIMTREGEATPRPRAIDWADRSPGASVRADLPSRIEAALCIPGTPMLIAVHESTAKFLKSFCPIKVVSSEKQSRSIRWCLQWHPSRERDPGGVWFRDLLRDAARSVHPRSGGSKRA